MPLLILAKTLLMYSKPNLHSLSIPKTVNCLVYTTLVTTALCALISYYNLLMFCPHLPRYQKPRPDFKQTVTEKIWYRLIPNVNVDFLASIFKYDRFLPKKPCIHAVKLFLKC